MRKEKNGSFVATGLDGRAVTIVRYVEIYDVGNASIIRVERFVVYFRTRRPHGTDSLMKWPLHSSAGSILAMNLSAALLADPSGRRSLWTSYRRRVSRRFHKLLPPFVTFALHGMEGGVVLGQVRFERRAIFVPRIGMLGRGLRFAASFSRGRDLLLGDFSLSEIVGIEFHPQLFQFDCRTSPIYTVVLAVPAQDVFPVVSLQPSHGGLQTSRPLHAFPARSQ